MLTIAALLLLFCLRVRVEKALSSVDDAEVLEIDVDNVLAEVDFYKGKLIKSSILG